jgi:hypothetical protein
MSNHGIVDLDLSAVRPLQSGNAAQRCGFAAPAGSQENAKLSFADVEVDTVDSGNRIGAVTEFL